MDYIVFSSLRGTQVREIVFSYDVACEWFKNVWRRMTILPPDIWLSRCVDKVMFLVPKFHLSAHIPPCKIKHSFNFTKNVGRTEGEAPERGWANTNALAGSTREMGPGFRRDTLDDHFNDWNWKKITGLGMYDTKNCKSDAYG